MSEYVNSVPEEDFLTEEKKGFVCDSDSAAEWLLKFIREAEDACRTMTEFYQEQTRKEEVIRDRKRAWAEWKLSEYFRTVPHRKAKKSESYPLPSGKLVWKQRDPEFDTKDPAFLEWLKKNSPEYVETKEVPKWGEFKKTLLKDRDGNFETVAETVDDERTVRRVLTEDGEIIPGVVARLRTNEFVVEVK